MNRRALIALTAAGLLWGLTIPLTKVALGSLDPAWLTVVRFGAAAPLLAWFARRHLRAACTPAVAAWGAMGFGMVIVLQNLGIERTSVSHAALVCGAIPALVAVVALTIGRGTSGPLAWLGYAAAIGGVATVAGVGGSQTASLTGDLLVLASAVLSALFIVAQTRNLQGRDAIAVTAVQMAAAALAVLPLALTAGEARVPDGDALLAIAALCTAGALPYALYAYGQARVKAETAGAFINLEPLVGAFAGAMAFGDPLGGAQLVGGLAILGGLALSVLPGPAPRRLRVSAS